MKLMMLRIPGKMGDPYASSVSSTIQGQMLVNFKFKVQLQDLSKEFLYIFYIFSMLSGVNILAPDDSFLLVKSGLFSIECGLVYTHLTIRDDLKLCLKTTTNQKRLLRIFFSFQKWIHGLWCLLSPIFWYDNYFQYLWALNFLYLKFSFCFSLAPFPLITTVHAKGDLNLFPCAIWWRLFVNAQ